MRQKLLSLQSPEPGTGEVFGLQTVSYWHSWLGLPVSFSFIWKDKCWRVPIASSKYVSSLPYVCLVSPCLEMPPMLLLCCLNFRSAVWLNSTQEFHTFPPSLCWLKYKYPALAEETGFFGTCGWVLVAVTSGVFSVALEGSKQCSGSLNVFEPFRVLSTWICSLASLICKSRMLIATALVFLVTLRNT